MDTCRNGNAQVDEDIVVFCATVLDFFTERPIGTVAREYLERVFSPNFVDLTRKLIALCNNRSPSRAHYELDGRTPARPAGSPHDASRRHCSGLFRIRMAS